MPIIKENDKSEWHGVKCAGCKKKETIRIKKGTLYDHKAWNDKHEWFCSSCRKDRKA